MDYGNNNENDGINKDILDGHIPSPNDDMASGLDNGNTKPDNKSKALLKKNGLAKIIIPMVVIAVLFILYQSKNPNPQDVAASTDTNVDFELIADSSIDLNNLKEYGLPIIMDFGASWCPPCQLMEPTLVKLNGELRDKAIIKYVDVDELMEFAADYPVTVVPTQFLFNSDGTPFNPSGYMSVELVKYTSKDTNEHVLTAHEGYLDEETILFLLKEMGMEND